MTRLPRCGWLPRCCGSTEATVTYSPPLDWTNDDWDDSTQSLVARGLIGTNGNLTSAGHSLRHAVEAQTDQLASSAIDHLEPNEVKRVIDIAATASRGLIDVGIIRVPNPIGVPRPTS